MLRFAFVLLATTLAIGMVNVAQAEIRGDYLEMRSCDIYTGPCFANSQIGLMGDQAIMAWSIEEGDFQGTDLAGLKVVMSVRANDTLGFGGGVEFDPDPIRSVILVDDQANDAQREALTAFARQRAGIVAGTVVRVASVAIEMSVDHLEMVGKLKAGKEVHLLTRKVRKGDCVCSNEEIFYPPLSTVENAEPAFTIDGGFAGRGLGSKWTNPKSKSAYLATFVE